MNQDISRSRVFHWRFELDLGPLLLVLPVVAGAQSSSAGPSSDACAALMQLNLADAQGGPAVMTSARAVDV